MHYLNFFLMNSYHSYKNNNAIAYCECPSCYVLRPMRQLIAPEGTSLQIRVSVAGVDLKPSSDAGDGLLWGGGPVCVGRRRATQRLRPFTETAATEGEKSPALACTRPDAPENCLCSKPLCTVLSWTSASCLCQFG